MAADERDNLLMARVARGDSAAFRELFDRHHARLLNFAWRFFRNHSQAEEAVQEAFLRLWKARKRWKPKARFTTWLYTIAGRVCLNELRKSAGGKHDGDPAATAVAEGPDPHAGVEARRTAALVEQIVSGLPERPRAALLLVRFSGLSYRETASALKMSEQAVKSAVFRATDAVRRGLVEMERRVANESGM